MSSAQKHQHIETTGFARRLKKSKMHVGSSLQDSEIFKYRPKQNSRVTKTTARIKKPGTRPGFY